MGVGFAAAAPSLRLDFRPSILERLTPADGKWEPLPVEMDARIATEGKAVEVVIERSHARPQDRWIEGRVASASAEDETMVIESRGPVASCVRFEGFYRTADGVQLARHITRVENSAGQPMAKVTHTLILTNDTNEVWFKEVGWEFAVAAGTGAQGIFGSSYAEPRKALSVALTPAMPSAYMLQDAHYFFGHGKNHFSVAGVSREGRSEVRLEGEQCGSWAALAGPSGGLQVFCHDAARQHPKEFEVFGERMHERAAAPCGTSPMARFVQPWTTATCIGGR